MNIKNLKIQIKSTRKRQNPKKKTKEKERKKEKKQMGIRKGQREKGNREKKEKKTIKPKHVLFGLCIYEQEFRVYFPIFSLIWRKSFLVGLRRKQSSNTSFIS